ncbi:phosphate ABC transporter substrate-binding/OmpA family protein [Sedimenticola sp.]|uniref:phosphate ABC transporter substrate-binding/OmpA family protein n=1 Tax=Sedimenticola sp. TaxID=1940285 RepID=UPI003D130A3A
MPRHVKIAMGVFLGIAILSVGGRLAVDKFRSVTSLSASDAGKVSRSYRIGVDNWIGYAPLCGDEMARRLAKAGLGLECVNDNADYKSRFAALREGKLDLAVTTVDAYLRDFDRNGSSGPLVVVIDESAGGDAIIARRDAAPNLDALKRGNSSTMTVAYTPASPSEYLMLSLGQHFGIPFEDGKHFRELKTDGSSAALEALQTGAAQVGVLWEPDVSTALKNPDLVKILGSEDTAGLIIDALAASPKMVSSHEEDLRIIIRTFFDTLDFYESETDRRNADLSIQAGAKEKDVAAMVAGVHWIFLLENGVTWFDQGPNGFGNKRLTKALHSTQAILHRAGKVKSPRLSSSAALSLVYSRVVENMYSEVFGQSAVQTGTKRQFRKLTGDEWSRLRPIGALQVDNITFQPGTSLLTVKSRIALDEVAKMLEYYPNYRLVIRGHTSNVGDAGANRELSVKRASSVQDYLLFNHPIDANRIRAEGYGGERPTERLPGESLRAWRYRLPRVEMAVVGERR